MDGLQAMREEFWDTQPHYGGAKGMFTMFTPRRITLGGFEFMKQILVF